MFYRYKKLDFYLPLSKYNNHFYFVLKFYLSRRYYILHDKASIFHKSMIISLVLSDFLLELVLYPLALFCRSFPKFSNGICAEHSYTRRYLSRLNKLKYRLNQSNISSLMCFMAVDVKMIAPVIASSRLRANIGAALSVCSLYMT